MALAVRASAPPERFSGHPPTAAYEAQFQLAADLIGVESHAGSRERKGKKSKTACANFAHTDKQPTDYKQQSSPSIMGATDSLYAGCIGVIGRHQERRKGRYISETLIKCDDARHGGPYCGIGRPRPSPLLCPTQLGAAGDTVRPPCAARPPTFLKARCNRCSHMDRTRIYPG